MISLYDPFAAGLQLLRTDRCFLSGQPVGPADTIPVFDDWLKTAYGLTDWPIQLLDQSTTTFGALRLPLAPSLRPRLAELQQQVQTAAEAGAAALRALGDEALFWWLGKMFYGIFVAELQQQQQPLIKPLYPLAENAHLLRRFQVFFQLLQGLRLPLEYADFAPASVFVLDVEPTADDRPFEYDDDLNTLVFSIKLGRSVITACLFDIGLIGRAMSRVYQEAQRPLHPAQAAEFKARVYYAAYLLSVIPDVYPRPAGPHDRPGAEVVLDALLDDITSAVFNPWENSAYARTLATMWRRWGISEKEILRNPDLPLSLLYDSQGQPQTLTRLPLPG